MTESTSRCEFHSDDLMIRVQKELPGETTAIPEVVEQIMEVVRDQQCAENAEFEIEVSLYEALANAVEHGCGHDPEKRVEIVVACEEHRGMIIIVRDPGEGFDPASESSCFRAQDMRLRSTGAPQFGLSCRCLSSAGASISGPIWKL